jgi:hypothetical protein
VNGVSAVLDADQTRSPWNFSDRLLDQCAGQHVRLAQHLEAVADAEHVAAVGGEALHVGHDRAEAGDGAGAQVVAVAEAAGQHDEVAVAELLLAVPDEVRLAQHVGDGLVAVVVAVGAGEGDDGCLHLTRPAGAR